MRSEAASLHFVSFLVFSQRVRRQRHFALLRSWSPRANALGGIGKNMEFFPGLLTLTRSEAASLLSVVLGFLTLTRSEASEKIWNFFLVSSR